MENILRAYVGLWSEHNEAHRETLVKQCLAHDAEIIGPGYRFLGHQAISDEVERFHRQGSGQRAVATSGFDTHGRWVRFTIAVIGPDGAVVSEGWDVLELAPDGRIARVITFWGALPLAVGQRQDL